MIDQDRAGLTMLEEIAEWVHLVFWSVSVGRSEHLFILKAFVGSEITSYTPILYVPKLFVRSMIHLTNRQIMMHAHAKAIKNFSFVRYLNEKKKNHLGNV